eukprot:gene13542-biopygen5283
MREVYDRFHAWVRQPSSTTAAAPARAAAGQQREQRGQQGGRQGQARGARRPRRYRRLLGTPPLPPSSLRPGQGSAQGDQGGSANQFADPYDRVAAARVGSSFSGPGRRGAEAARRELHRTFEWLHETERHGCSPAQGGGGDCGAIIPPPPFEWLALEGKVARRHREEVGTAEQSHPHLPFGHGIIKGYGGVVC